MGAVAVEPVGEDAGAAFGLPPAAPVRAGGAVSPPPPQDEVLERWADEADADAAAARAGRTPGGSPSSRSAPSPTPRSAPSPAGAPAADGADGPVAELALVLQAARAGAGTDWHDLPGRQAHEALDVVEQLDRTFTAMRSRILTAIEAGGLWHLDGQRTFPTWVRDRTDTTPAAASRQVRTARALRDLLPLAQQALEQGRISAEHAGILVRDALRTDRLKAQLADDELGEEFLVAQAQEMDAGVFTKLVRAWAITADPEGADRAWRDADAKEEFTLAPTLGGYHLAGWLDELSGEVVHRALKAHMGRKGKDDERSPAQRRAGALVALAHQSLDAGQRQAHARVRPHVTVTTSWETLQALVAASGSVVPPLRSDGQPYPAGAAFGINADATLGAPGGPRSPDTDRADLFSLSEGARQWMQQWQPGEDHVIPAALDPRAMIGVEPATLEDGTPIPPALLARLACDSGLSRVMFGPKSTVLDVGREQRIFPAHMVKAIIARDRHCQVPDCDEPPGFGEIHHALQWYRDHGPTSVDLGVLVCWHHHDWIHANGITIARIDGAWSFYNRHGWLITSTRDRKP